VAIENQSGHTRSQVELLSRHLVRDTGFTVESVPSIADVDREIDATEAEILTWFASHNYSTDVAADWSAIAKRHVSWYNALGAAWHLEVAHSGAMFSDRASSRADAYFRMYMSLKESLDAGDSFVEVGIPLVSANIAQAAVTGVSKTEKAVLEDNVDAVKPLFTKRQFRDPKSDTPERLEQT